LLQGAFIEGVLSLQKAHSLSIDDQLTVASVRFSLLPEISIVRLMTKGLLGLEVSARLHSIGYEVQVILKATNSQLERMCKDSEVLVIDSLLSTFCPYSQSYLRLLTQSSANPPTIRLTDSSQVTCSRDDPSQQVY
jgi:hypothetical protein